MFKKVDNENREYNNINVYYYQNKCIIRSTKSVVIITYDMDDMDGVHILCRHYMSVI